MIVLIDNHDSFAWNLARHLSLLGPRVVVVPSHVATVADLHRLHPRALVISPGPCTPAEAGCSVDAVRSFTGVIPILGVCLGHQVIAAARGRPSCVRVSRCTAARVGCAMTRSISSPAFRIR